MITGYTVESVKFTFQEGDHNNVYVDVESVNIKTTDENGEISYYTVNADTEFITNKEKDDKVDK